MIIVVYFTTNYMFYNLHLESLLNFCSLHFAIDFQLPFSLIPLLHATSSRRVMGDFKNSMLVSLQIVGHETVHCHVGMARVKFPVNICDPISLLG